MHLVKFIAKAFLTTIWFILSCLVGFILILVLWKNPNANTYFARTFAWGAQKILGYKVLAHNTQYLYSHQPCIYVSNHQSNLDIITYGMHYPLKTVVIGKKEVIRIPFFGLFFYGAGNILIDRNDKSHSFAGFNLAKDALINRQTSIWIFPEGTRNYGLTKMLPLKKGAFHMAISAQVPVVALVHEPLKLYYDHKNKKITKKTIHIEVLKPFTTKGMTLEDMPKLMTLVSEEMNKTLERLSQSHTT